MDFELWFLTKILIKFYIFQPWDTRLSLKPLDGTPFVKNQFTMYVKVKQSAKLGRDSSDEYDTIYHYTGWTTRYSAQNLTIHSYSKSSTPPEHFRQAEYGARSVPGFKVPYEGQSQGVKTVSICEKIENKKPKNIFGKGMTLKSRKVLSESCSKGIGSSTNESSIMTHFVL